MTKAEENLGHHEKKRKGGMRAMPFIFSTEVCEKLAIIGFSANMMSYLTLQLHMPITKAANTVTNFNGTASFTPLIGAYFADAYVGRFLTITVASFIYQIGMISLTLSATLPWLRPPPCKANGVCEEAATWQLAILYVSLTLTAFGSGGIRPCVSAFGADQFYETDEKQKTKISNYFNWYYFCMGASSLMAITVIVYVQENVGWGWGLGIPTIIMSLSIVFFIIGFPLYNIYDPCGSPLTRLAQVVVAAIRKRRLSVISDSRLLYNNDELDDSISKTGKLLHTKQLTFFDKAAIVTEEDIQMKSTSLDLWRLSTVHRVEELKSLIRMVPIWASGILVTTAAAQGSFFIQQARTMDRNLTPSFQIPPGSMYSFTSITMLATIAIYDRFLIPIARRFTSLDRGISLLHRMGIGFAFAILGTLIAGFTEVKRKEVASVHGLTDSPDSTIPISVLWLIPQYAFMGLTEAFLSVGILEFLYDQAPESMRSTAMALFWMVNSAGNYISTILVTLVHRFSAGSGGSNWLPDDNLNKGRLEYFYWLITLLQIFNLVYYLICARFYTFKPIQLSRTQGGVEIASQV